MLYVAEKSTIQPTALLPRLSIKTLSPFQPALFICSALCIEHHGSLAADHPLPAIQSEYCYGGHLDDIQRDISNDSNIPGDMGVLGINHHNNSNQTRPSP